MLLRSHETHNRYSIPASLKAPTTTRQSLSRNDLLDFQTVDDRLRLEDGAGLLSFPVLVPIYSTDVVLNSWDARDHFPALLIIPKNTLHARSKHLVHGKLPDPTLEHSASGAGSGIHSQKPRPSLGQSVTPTPSKLRRTVVRRNF